MTCSMSSAWRRGPGQHRPRRLAHFAVGDDGGTGSCYLPKRPSWEPGVTLHGPDSGFYTHGVVSVLVCNDGCPSSPSTIRQHKSRAQSQSGMASTRSPALVSPRSGPYWMDGAAGWWPRPPDTPFPGSEPDAAPVCGVDRPACRSPRTVSCPSWPRRRAPTAITASSPTGTWEMPRTVLARPSPPRRDRECHPSTSSTVWALNHLPSGQLRRHTPPGWRYSRDGPQHRLAWTARIGLGEHGRVTRSRPSGGEFFGSLAGADQARARQLPPHTVESAGHALALGSCAVRSCPGPIARPDHSLPRTAAVGNQRAAHPANVDAVPANSRQSRSATSLLLCPLPSYLARDQHSADGHKVIPAATEVQTRRPPSTGQIVAGRTIALPWPPIARSVCCIEDPDTVGFGSVAASM